MKKTYVTKEVYTTPLIQPIFTNNVVKINPCFIKTGGIK